MDIQKFQRDLVFKKWGKIEIALRSETTGNENEIIQITFYQTKVAFYIKNY